MIEFKHVTKQYDNGFVAVSDLSFVAPTGKITVLVGPSGCGKTTTLRMINRLNDATSGEILLGGVPQSDIDTIQMRRQIGYVIQNAGLFPHRTILQNICTVPYLNKADKQHTQSRARELMQLVGLDLEYADRFPWQLSGGQQQRVGVARALAADPPYMLMDEPFSAVDPIVRKQLQDEFLKIQGKIAKTIVMVTHDIDEALRLGDQIIVLKEGGLIAQVGTPREILQKPANQFVADFLGSSRGYHALTFEPIPHEHVEPTPSVIMGEALESNHGGWAVVLDHTKNPVGWVDASSRLDVVRESDVLWSEAISLTTGNMRQIVDASLSGPAHRGIVIDGSGVYVGTIRADEVLAHRTLQGVSSRIGDGDSHAD